MLAIGIVVDDAIVVVENVERHIAEGLSPVDATHKAMDEVSGAVIAIALVLSAVFIPTAFISGITGKFYQQFALTIAVSTLISAFNSLTLSPALCALLLQPHHAPKDLIGRVIHYSVDWLFRAFNRVFEGGRANYVRVLGRVLRHCGIALVLYAALLALTWFGFHKVPTGFIPSAGQGQYLLLSPASGRRVPPAHGGGQPAGRASADATRPASPPCRSSPACRSSPWATAPMPSSMFIRLSPFEERAKAGLTADVIMANLRKAIAGPTSRRLRCGRPARRRWTGWARWAGSSCRSRTAPMLGFQALQAATFQLMGAAMPGPTRSPRRSPPSAPACRRSSSTWTAPRPRSMHVPLERGLGHAADLSRLALRQ